MAKYSGWRFLLSVQADDLGDCGDLPEDECYQAFIEQYQSNVEAAYPGADVTIRRTNTMGVRSAGEYPHIWEPEDYAMTQGEYEDMRVRLAEIGDQVFEKGEFWPVRAEEDDHGLAV